jgi:hypothetical protein
MYSDHKNVDSITVLGDGQLLIRTVTIVLNNDVEISRSYHRHCLCPGDDLSNEEPKVVAVATVVWTPEVLAAWQSRPQEPVTA